MPPRRTRRRSKKHTTRRIARHITKAHRSPRRSRVGKRVGKKVGKRVGKRRTRRAPRARGSPTSNAWKNGRTLAEKLREKHSSSSTSSSTQVSHDDLRIYIENLSDNKDLWFKQQNAWLQKYKNDREKEKITNKQKKDKEDIINRLKRVLYKKKNVYTIKDFEDEKAVADLYKTRNTNFEEFDLNKIERDLKDIKNIYEREKLKTLSELFDFINCPHDHYISYPRRIDNLGVFFSLNSLQERVSVKVHCRTALYKFAKANKTTKTVAKHAAAKTTKTAAKPAAAKTTKTVAKPAAAKKWGDRDENDEEEKINWSKLPYTDEELEKLVPAAAKKTYSDVVKGNR